MKKSASAQDILDQISRVEHHLAQVEKALTRLQALRPEFYWSVPFVCFDYVRALQDKIEMLKTEVSHCCQTDF